MSSCTFFGHADSSLDILPYVEALVLDLIVNNGVDTFYIGTEGRYDTMCYKILSDLKFQFPDVKIYRVLAYIPKDERFSEDSIYPENIETVPKRFAISWRNKWMIEKSDYAITYAIRKFGGAYKFENLAIKKKLNVIKIAEML